ncbi:hypothetical protein CYG48_05065 [Neorhizobium sp. SOG26]|uniref:hypothetical protein n=1 Tax=Neorhizobium sp. SOG26 TaxID=2060726 RepID=UPI000E5870BD|nr:hypothetical protein [Neorhizobium sp. SOG26]AXV15124.1 hypothetical protein CYG48_05065 [Neorhizobium sp. SOG26]
MPFDRSRPLSTAGAVGVAAFDAPEPSFLETVGAAFRQENLIGSALTNANLWGDQASLTKVDPTYNVYQDPDFADLIKEAPDQWDEVYNRTAADAKRAQIEKERKDRATLAASGWTGVGASFVAGIADPTILLPGGALARTGKVGFNAFRSAASVGAMAAAGTAVQEAGLQATQEERTATESAIAIGGSAILGGLIGAGASKFLSTGEWTRVSKQIESDLAEEGVEDVVGMTDTIVKRMQSAGAAAVDEIKLDDLGVGGPKAAQIVARATAAARINPGIETMFSPSVKVRETYARMVDNPVYTTMQMEGRSLGADVENLVKQYQRGALAQWLESSRNIYREARKAGYTGSKTEFYQAVAKAGRRGDVDPGGNEFVTRAAQEARSTVFNPLLERAQRIGLLPEDVKVSTAASYVTRLWNRQKLIGEEERFRKIARQYFAEQIAKLPEGKGPDAINDDDLKDYIEDVVTSVFNNLTGKGLADVPDWLVPVKRGPLKERTFNIPDELVEEFLENDMEAVLRRYTRTMGAEVELADKFGRADMKPQFEEIANEYNDLRKNAKTDDERQRLHKAEARDLKNLQAFRDMIRGTYRAADEASDWSKITRAALTWNYIRLLGGVTLASLTDASRFVAVHGVRATMREALPALTKGVKAAKISRADAKALGAVTERVLQSRLASLTDLNDPYAYGSRFERFLSNASNVFSRATGLGWWNDTLKTVASVMTQNRMMRNALDWHGADKTERAYMAYLGINEDMAERIAAQFRKYGVEEEGVYGANVSQWDDQAAVRAWGAALNKDVDRTIITKGVTDTPLWMKTNWGKLIFQFKSFGLASNQRVLIAGLQERPHRLAEMMVMSSALGMLIGYLKYVERGDMDEANKLLDNPGLWIAEGLDRSGVLAIPFEISNTAEKLGLPGIVTAAQAVAGDEDRGGGASRYASRGKLGAVLGPSSGLFEDLAMIAQQLSEGDLKKSGANAIIRQVPGATLPGIRTAIHVGVKPALQEAVQ